MFAFVLLALSGVASALTMHTPASLVQCQPIKLSWDAGVAPYYLSVVPGGQPGATPLVSWPKMDLAYQTWMVNLPAGTSVNIMVTDSTGENSVTSAVTVMAGGNTDCMNVSASEEPSTPAASAAETPAASGSPSPAASEAPASAEETSTPAASSAPAPASSAASSAKPVSSAVSSSASRPASSAASASATPAPVDSGAGRVAVGGAVAAVAGLVALAAF